jgi:dihydropteroate synthase
MTRLMGIVNVTPDSFSDGGLYLDADRAIGHARELAAEGADLLDVGGESTRPGAQAVSAEAELRRVLPVLEGLSGVSVPVSIDTSKAAVAEAALEAGAGLVNDVTALRADPELAAVCAARGCDVVLMHMKGSPRTMQEAPAYGDVVEDVKGFLAERIDFATGAGIAEDRIWVDPGIGFGRPSNTIWSSFAGWASCATSAGRSSSGHPARASSAGSPVATSTSGSAARSRRTCSRSGRARTSSGCTTWLRSGRRCAWPRRF